LPASNPAEAAEVYRLRRVTALSCLTPAYVELRGYAPSPAPHPFALAKGETVRLRGESQLGLSVIEEYDIAQTPEGGWQTRVVAYFYAIEQDGSELLAYHWHPHGKSPITSPHLHVRADVQVGERWLGKVHLPTGAIELEDVVALAIEELGADPLREDWELLLRETRCH
jgi:hypothetical protein